MLMWLNFSMHRVATMLRRRTERFHMVFHVMFGIICGYFVHDLFPDSNLRNLIFWGVWGSLLPDIDHFVYFYFYGKHTEYSKVVRQYIKDKKIWDLFNFWKFNHKKSNGPRLYSHNILFVILTLYLFNYFVQVKDMPTFSVLALSIFTHLIFDMGEDILFMKKLNPNWYLQFKRGK